MTETMEAITAITSWLFSLFTHIELPCFHTLADFHHPYVVAKHEVCTLMPLFRYCNKGHGLGTRERLENGMCVLPIFCIHKMATQLPLDVM